MASSTSSSSASSAQHHHPGGSELKGLFQTVFSPLLFILYNHNNVMITVLPASSCFFFSFLFFFIRRACGIIMLFCLNKIQVSLSLSFFLLHIFLFSFVQLLWLGLYTNALPHPICYCPPTQWPAEEYKEDNNNNTPCPPCYCLHTLNLITALHTNLNTETIYCNSTVVCSSLGYLQLSTVRSYVVLSSFVFRLLLTFLRF